MREFTLPMHEGRHRAADCLTSGRVLEVCNALCARIDPRRGRPWVRSEALEAVYQPDRAICAAFTLEDEAVSSPHRSWAERRIVYLRTPVRSPVSRRGSVIELDGHGFELYRFPNDRRLVGLRHVTGREAMTALWRRCAATGAIESAPLQRQLLKYVPERKCVARLRRRDEASSDDTLPGGIALRVCRRGVAERIAARHEAARHGAKQQGLSIKFPQVLDLDRRREVLALPWIKGVGVLDELGLGRTDQVMARCAESLEALQSLHVPNLPPITPDLLIHRMRRMAGDLMRCAPELEGDLQASAVRMADILRASQPARIVTLHGDWHFDQLRLRTRRCVILDLDRMSQGDALLDIANFTVQMRLLGHRADYDLSPDACARSADVYLRAHGNPHEAETSDRFAAYAAYAAIGLGWAMLRHLRPGWPGLARQCVREAQGWLTGRALEASPCGGSDRP